MGYIILKDFFLACDNKDIKVEVWDGETTNNIDGIWEPYCVFKLRNWIREAKEYLNWEVDHFKFERDGSLIVYILR